MPNPPTDSHASDPLKELAALYGIEPEFWDIWRRPHVPSPEVQRAILNSLGVEANSEAEVNAAVETALLRDWSQPIPPTVVVCAEKPLAIPIRMLEVHLTAPVHIRIEQEDGQTKSLDLKIEAWTRAAQITIGGKHYVQVEESWDTIVPPGYHWLHASTAAGDYHARLIATPQRAWMPE